MAPVHEFSIADALATQVVRHAPEGARVREVEIVVGALRGLEPDALQMCWQAVTLDTRLAGSILKVDQRPWTISCSSCGRTWESEVPFVTCECGNESPSPSGGDELDLVSLTVDQESD
jgi:hydrogenase nickel incorporation protein HypA/HybF